MKKLLIITLLGSIILHSSFALAADQKPAAAEVKKDRPIPFRGKVTAMDSQAKTVTLGTRVFVLTDKTKVSTGDKAGSIGDVKVGESVTGSYRNVEGRMELQSLYVGTVKKEGK